MVIEYCLCLGILFVRYRGDAGRYISSLFVLILFQSRAEVLEINTIPGCINYLLIQMANVQYQYQCAPKYELQGILNNY